MSSRQPSPAPPPPPEASPDPLQVYRELRNLAAAYLSHEALGHTLQPTALVNEAMLRLLIGGNRAGCNGAGTTNPALLAASSPRQFLALASCCMQHILVDHARARCTAKRSADAGSPGSKPVSLSRSRPVGSHDAAALPLVDILALSEAIEKLEALDARAAEIVRLRFFAGLTIEQAALLLEISEATAEHDWRVARAWLGRWLTA